jgi:hypothetical protein
VTSIIKIVQLPSISNSSFTESTTQLVILGAAESAITIIAASIPILRALVRDYARPPPGPASFYRSLDLRGFNAESNNNPISGDIGMMYAGAAGRSSTVITSSGGRAHSRNRSISQSRSSSSRSSSSLAWHSSSKESAGSITTTLPAKPMARLTLSRLSRFSGLSLLAAVEGTRGEKGAEVQKTDQSHRASSGLGSEERLEGKVEQGNHRTRGGIQEGLAPPTPPPGTIVTTEEVMVEFEEGRRGHLP